jgi:hypothetical protein
LDFVPVNQVVNIEELDMKVAGMLSRACIAIDNVVGNVGIGIIWIHFEFNVFAELLVI